MLYSIPHLSRKTPVFVLTVQWVVNPLVPIRYTLYCVPYSVLFTCVLRSWNDQFRTYLLLCTYL
jgi:hypothetical protein